MATAAEIEITPLPPSPDSPDNAVVPALPAPIDEIKTDAIEAEQVVAVVDGTTTSQEEITITDQDVLFGRGGLTNRHKGNLRYRDCISLHREDYTRSSKSEKPSVARRIVQAIRSGKTPGRFLKRGHDGKWIEVCDKEAAWKASQALREKTRWSCMKEAEGFHFESDSIDASAKKEEDAGLPNTPKKRKLEEESKGGVSGSEEKKESPKKKKVPSLSVDSSLQVGSLKEPSQIMIPAVASVASIKDEKKKSAHPKLVIDESTKPTRNSESIDGIIPKNEDVLFGRGGRTNHHPGNIRLREVVKQYQEAYQLAKKVDKPKISKLIVSALRSSNPPSRFLRMDGETNKWVDVGQKRAAEKVSQTLREKEREHDARTKHAKPVAPQPILLVPQPNPETTTQPPKQIAPKLTPMSPKSDSLPKPDSPPKLDSPPKSLDVKEEVSV